MKTKKENKQKKTKAKILLNVGLPTIVLAAAISVPFFVVNKPTQTFNFNYSDTLEGNKNRVDDFVTKLSLDNSPLRDSLKVYGKDGLIGKTGKELNSQERSFVTIEQCNAENLFNFEFPSSLKYSLRKSGINAKKEYVKSDYSNTSYPIVGIKFYAGYGENYYESIFEYKELGLYGFKKNNEQLFINQIIQDIVKNPNIYFELKSDIGSVGQIGLYSKNIKVENFEYNNSKLVELRKNNFYVTISSVKTNPFNPSNLKLYFDIAYNDGINTSYSVYNEVIIPGFDVEDGVDDPKSIVKNFINTEEQYIKNLNQYFSFKIPNEEKTETKPTMSAKDAYDKGYITFDPTYSISSKFDSLGIKVAFKSHNENDKWNVFNSEFDSTMPMYRLYFTSYVGTPFEYTEDVVIEGLNQQGDFIVSEQENKMKKIVDYLDENNQNFENFISVDWNNFRLLNEFANKTSNDLTINILNSAFKKYKEDVTENKPPFEVKLKKTNTNVNDPAIDNIINEIIESMNKLPLEKLVDAIDINDQKNEIKINITLGTYQQDLYMSLLPLIVENNEIETHFMSEINYSDKQLEQMANFITNNPNKILVNLNESSGIITNDILVNLLKNKNWKNIFESINIINSPNVIEYPEYDSNLEVEIDFNKLSELTNTEIESIINDQEMDIPLIVVKQNSSNWRGNLKVTKTFNQLITRT